MMHATQCFRGRGDVVTAGRGLLIRILHGSVIILPLIGFFISSNGVYMAGERAASVLSGYTLLVLEGRFGVLLRDVASVRWNLLGDAGADVGDVGGGDWRPAGRGACSCLRAFDFDLWVFLINHASTIGVHAKQTISAPS